MSTNDTSKNLDLATELDKVKNVLGALWAKVTHSSEAEAQGVSDLIDAIGAQPVTEPETPAAEDTEVVPGAETKPLSEMTTEELQAELAKRTPVGSGS